MENRLVSMGRGEKRVRCMGRVTWKHITICKIVLLFRVEFIFL